ncbi:glycosyltransferase family 2 protein [Nostoc sp. FACHB-152]|uniref:glycosyltransferase n=1 Tax=unclassified Nostoc TaxID=2593658 RepID=UPI001682EAAE|nr:MULTISPECIES: glycosyltransferase family 2 protein [unclassified Nostoc]MBD2449335.1 glycosyltransferase family 2 protein [Nostoc sp. FACHB-152]MBD2470497.1 glycosyltransferase family 2 protein [Nostoc sp. FACHB-145]
MNELIIFLSRCLLSWLAIQICSVLALLWCLSSRPQDPLLDEELPKTAVILCLRGADPFLPNCLRSLFHQNYPQYDVKLVIDSIEDPAWQIAQDTINEVSATNVDIKPLKIVHNTCSLKCSSLIQAVSELDESYEVVALVDADTVVHPNWLRDLVTPLNHPKVGATTGNRWYIPTGRYWGTLVRYIWNVSALVQMFLYGIPWGGTLAIKTAVLRQTGLLDKWSKAFGEDTMIRSVLGKHKLQVKFVPSLIMLNREECDLPSLRYWFQRQLLSSRLYHPLWPAVAADVIFTILLPNFLLVVFLAALLIGDGESANLALSWYVSYMLALVMLILVLELAVQPEIHVQGQQVTKLSAAIICKIAIALPFTQWIYGLAMLASFQMPTVHWRGVTYQVQSPWNIRLVEYLPYQMVDQPSDRKVSL